MNDALARTSDDHAALPALLSLAEAAETALERGDARGAALALHRRAALLMGNERIDAGVSISKPTRKVLSDFHLVIERALGSAIQAVSQSNQEVARLVINMKDEISNLADSAATHQARRLVAEEPNRIPAYTIEIDIIEKQKRIYYFAKRMAKSVFASHMDPEKAA